MVSYRIVRVGIGIGIGPLVGIGIGNRYRGKTRQFHQNHEKYADFH